LDAAGSLSQTATGNRQSASTGGNRHRVAQEKKGEPLEPPKERASNRIEKVPTRTAVITRRQEDALAMVPVAYDTTAELFLDLSEARQIVRDA
jgi:hypothetical protein